MATYTYAQGQIKRVFVTGNTATTALTCTGIAAEDTVLWINHISTAASVATIAAIDLDEVTVGAATVTLSTTDTSNDSLEVVFLDRSV